MLLIIDCKSIPTSDTYDVVYNTDSVLYPDPVPIGKQLPRTKATITCKEGLFFPYSFTNTLAITSTSTFTCSSGTFGVTAPVCKKSIFKMFIFSKKTLIVILSTIKFLTLQTIQ